MCRPLIVEVLIFDPGEGPRGYQTSTNTFEPPEAPLELLYLFRFVPKGSGSGREPNESSVWSGSKDTKYITEKYTLSSSRTGNGVRQKAYRDVSGPSFIFVSVVLESQSVRSEDVPSGRDESTGVEGRVDHHDGIVYDDVRR